MLRGGNGPVQTAQLGDLFGAKLTQIVAVLMDQAKQLQHARRRHLQALEFVEPDRLAMKTQIQRQLTSTLCWQRKVCIGALQQAQTVFVSIYIPNVRV